MRKAKFLVIMILTILVFSLLTVNVNAETTDEIQEQDPEQKIRNELLTSTMLTDETISADYFRLAKELGSNVHVKQGKAEWDFWSNKIKNCVDFNSKVTTQLTKPDELPIPFWRGVYTKFEQQGNFPGEATLKLNMEEFYGTDETYLIRVYWYNPNNSYEQQVSISGQCSNGIMYITIPDLKAGWYVISCYSPDNLSLPIIEPIGYVDTLAPGNSNTSTNTTTNTTTNNTVTNTNTTTNTVTNTNTTNNVTTNTTTNTVTNTNTISNATTNTTIGNTTISKTDSEILSEITRGDINIPASSKENISAKYFEVAKNNKKDITVKADEKISWKFASQDISNTSIAFNPHVKSSSKKDDFSSIQSNLILDAVFVDFAHNGNLPGKAKVTLNIGAEKFGKASKTLYMYYYNPSNNGYEYVGEVSYENGIAKLEITHCSTYALMDHKLELAGGAPAPAVAPVAAVGKLDNEPKAGEMSIVPVAMLSIISLAVAMVIKKQ